MFVRKKYVNGGTLANRMWPVSVRLLHNSENTL